MREGKEELEFNGKFFSGHEYIESLVKCHRDPRKLWIEIITIRKLGKHENVLSSLGNLFQQRTIPGASNELYYYTLPFEAAPRGFDELIQHCFSDKDCTIPKFSVIRSVCNGVIKGFRRFHQKRFTHGKVDKDSVRWILEDGKIVIKICNFGSAVKPKCSLGDRVIRGEVSAIGYLLNSLSSL